MKSNISATVFVIFVLFLFIGPEAKERQKTEWKGNIEYENGVKVIKNPKEPLYGDIQFELEEDLNIGRKDDENYTFYRVRAIEVDSQGNIYILDAGNHRVQKFDKNGNHLLSILPRFKAFAFHLVTG